MSKTSKVFTLVIDADNSDQKINCLDKKVFLYFANLAYNARAKEAFLETKELKKEKEAMEALQTVGIDVTTQKEGDSISGLWINDLKAETDYFKAAIALAENNLEEYTKILAEEVTEAVTEEANSCPAYYCTCDFCGEKFMSSEYPDDCPACEAAIEPEVDLVHCVSETCLASVFVTDDVKQCPYCDTDLYSIEEKLQNAGVIKTEDPAKAEKIETKKQARLLEEKKELQKEIEDYAIIVDGFNPKAIDAAWIILQTQSSKYLEKAREEDESKEKQNLLKAAKTVIKSIESLQNLSEFVESLENKLSSMKGNLKRIEESIKNIQLELDLPVKDEPVAKPCLTVVKKSKEVSQVDPSDIVNPVAEEACPEEMTFEKEVSEVA